MIFFWAVYNLFFYFIFYFYILEQAGTTQCSLMTSFRDFPSSFSLQWWSTHASANLYWIQSELIQPNNPLTLAVALCQSWLQTQGRSFQLLSLKRTSQRWRGSPVCCVSAMKCFRFGLLATTQVGFNPTASPLLHCCCLARHHIFKFRLTLLSEQKLSMKTRLPDKSKSWVEDSCSSHKHPLWDAGFQSV